MGINELIARHPLDCFSELAGVRKDGAALLTYLGERVELGTSALQERETDLQKIFRQQAGTPAEVSLSPRQTRALELELFLVRLAQAEISRKREAARANY